MSVTQATLDRAIAAARQLESQGYFEKARQGDQKAASLFARLTAYTLNPTGSGGDYGCLSKSPGETQVDGFAEDAICYTNDPSDRQNVVDLINGAGAPGASIGGAVKERRENNLWVKPVPLTAEQMAYLKADAPPTPQPVQPYPSESPEGGWWGQVADAQIAKRYAAVHRPYPDPNDPKSLRWCGRIAYDIHAGLTKEASLAKHLLELEEELGL